MDTIVIGLACVIGFMMAWGVGANDLANVLSPTLGSRAISVRQAMCIAVIFEFAGAFFGGSEVTNTIRGGIINLSLVDVNLVVYGMLAILCSGACWMGLASYIGMPVSITNAVVGGLVGFGYIALGPSTIHWEVVKYIVISWVSSPIIAGIAAFLLVNVIRRTIMMDRHPAVAVRRQASIYLFMVGVILSIMIVVKGMNRFHIQLSFIPETELVLLTSLFLVLVGQIIINKVIYKHKISYHRELAIVEQVFGLLVGLTACAMVFAHGSNDVAIAVGPIAAIWGIMQHGHQLTESPVPLWIVALGCFGVVLGLITYGRKVIATVGSKITSLTASSAFAATLAAASTVIVSTSTGIPVSTTQTLVGAVLGAGLARGFGALNLRVIRNIILSWVVTLPVAAGLAVLFYDIIKELI